MSVGRDMYPNSDVDQQFALSTAHRLVEHEDQSGEIFEELRYGKRLSHTVHHLNALLSNMAHKELAARALGCLGFGDVKKN